MSRVDLSKLFAGASESFKALNRHLESPGPDSKPQQLRLCPLDGSGEDQKALVPLAGRIHFEFVRCGGQELDYDNLAGGCKAPRDLLAKRFLGRKGDSEQDGLSFGYRQEPRKRGEKVQKETLIEIYAEE